MRKLVRGIVDFRKNVRPSCKDAFAQLALGQKPDTLFIACSDSRVVPNLFASSDPGDLFVIRNVGNLIPPCDHQGRTEHDESEGAAIEFAVLALSVKEIIVCGHSECGAMTMLASGKVDQASYHLKNWLRHGEISLKQLENDTRIDSTLEVHNRLSQRNVFEQMEHLKTYPDVRERIEKGTLTIHGWWFDIREANVYEYEEAEGKFILIDDEFAKVLLARANLK